VRVLHIVPGISPSHGGPLNVPGLVRALRRHGVDAELRATDADPNGRLDVRVGERVVRDDVPVVFEHAWPIAGRWAYAPRLAARLRTETPTADVVHIHWLYNYPCIAAARAAMDAGVPFVVQPRGSLDPHLMTRHRLPKQLYLKTIASPLLTRAAAVVFTADDERDMAVYDRTVPEWVVPNGSDFAEFERLPPRGTFRAAYPALGHHPYLYFLGRLAHQKGLDLLVPAFAQIATEFPDLHLVLGGPDHQGYETVIRGLTRQLGIEHRVLFTGFLDTQRKLAGFADADLFVLPSYAENFGGVIIEALACGLPVVISNQVNIHRELSAAHLATVVECSVESVAAGIRTALKDTEGRAKVAAHAPAAVRRRYALDAIVPDLIAKYRGLASAKPGTVPA
jgi:glycosyltransferase involved in cell wall biosynthesis